MKLHLIEIQTAIEEQRDLIVNYQILDTPIPDNVIIKYISFPPSLVFFTNENK